jgi:1,4-alpha-glucan branching enzyme
MPVNDFGLIGPSGHSWGYDISHYFALEPSYGSPRDLKVLIDSAHARGIAVILDVVFNHLNDPAPLWVMHPDEVANPYFKPNTVLRYNEDALFFFRDLDHWTDETQELVYAVLKMWIDEYRVDGFRYDFTQGVGWNVAEPTRGILGWANQID